MRMKAVCAAVFVIGSVICCSAGELNLMPWPAKVEQQPGFLGLNHLPHFEIIGGDERVKYAATHLNEQLSVRTGIPIQQIGVSENERPLFVIHCNSLGSKVQALGEDESYKLIVDQKKAELTAANPLGILRGVETLLQLLQPGKDGWILPAVQVDDHPRFPWRGLMIDVSRHFMPVEAIKRNLDGMAAVKLNTLHLHLSDDEGFRVESRHYPRLQERASDGLFYTQSQVREIVAYARERGIRVVPEFDVPAHALSWIIAYPELSSSPIPSRLARDMTDHERPAPNPTQESTYKLLGQGAWRNGRALSRPIFSYRRRRGRQQVLGKQFEIQAWMHAHNIKDSEAMQAYFNKRIQKILAKHGKRMEGWDEILSPELPKDTLVQSWRGPKHWPRPRRWDIRPSCRRDGIWT